MSEAPLPFGWTNARLGSVLPIEYGAGLPKSRRAEGKVPVYGSNGVAGYHSESLTTGPAIIVGRKGSAGAVQLCLEPCWPIDTTYFAVGSESVDLQYFFHLLTHCRLDQLDRSTAIPSLSRDDYNEVCVPVAPLPEQRRIVAKIEELFSDLDAGVAALERVRANLKRYRAAVLKAAVEGRLTEEWRKQHPATEPAAKLLQRILAERRAKWEQDQLRRFKIAGKEPPKGWKERYKSPVGHEETSLPELPANWSWTSLSVVAWQVRDGPHHSPKYSPAGIPFITGGHVRPDEIDFTRAKFISHELHKEFSRRCEPVVGDLLYTKGGTTGIAHIVRDERAFNVWVHVAVLKLADSINRRYLQHMLNSSLCYRQAQKYTHGVGNQDLGLTRMVKIAISLPPFAEQAEIVAEVDRRLSVADAAEQQVEHALQRAARLRQSILKRAFEGKLVPQDPADEPAATMLERAKALAIGHRAVIETSGTPRGSGRGDTPKRRSRARA